MLKQFIVINLLLGRTYCDTFRFDTLNYEFNHDLVNVSGSVDSKGVLNVEYDVFYPINTFYWHIANFKVKPKSLVIQRSINICKIFNMNSGSPFMVSIFKILKKKSNIPFSCPIKPGSYYLHGFSMKEFKLPPGRMLGLESKYIIEITMSSVLLVDEADIKKNKDKIIAKLWSKVSVVNQ